MTLQEKMIELNGYHAEHVRDFISSLRYVRTVAVEMRLDTRGIKLDDLLYSVRAADFKVQFETGTDVYGPLINPDGESKKSNVTLEFTILYDTVAGERRLMRGVKHLFEAAFPEATVFGP